MRSIDSTVADVVAQVSERSAFWTAKGFFGASLYEQLASDSELPENYSSREAAAIFDVQPDAMAGRRKRGGPPSFLRLAPNVVAYPRHSLFLHLRDSYVERRSPLAQREYTNA